MAGQTRVFAWGAGEDGQLGLPDACTGSDEWHISLPEAVPSLSDLPIASLVSGSRQSMALSAEGGLLVWGWNEKQSLGLGPRPQVKVPARVEGLREVQVQQACWGGWHGLAVTTEGEAFAWCVQETSSSRALAHAPSSSPRGGNENLQTGATETPSQTEPLPKRILPQVRVRCVAAGSMHSIALTDSGHVWAWGQPLTSWGQPDGSNCYVRQRGPVRVEGIDNVVQIAAGAFHNLALTASGHVLAWGNSDYGQLGLGSTTHVAAPHIIPELSRAGVISLSAGGWHSGAITAGGVVYMWGRGEHGRLGLGDDTRDRLRPVELQLRSRVQHLSLGGTHSVVVTEHGELLSCGRPSFGRLGRGGNPNVLQPVEFPVAPQGCRWLCETASAGGRHTLAACRSVLLEEGEGEWDEGEGGATYPPLFQIARPGTPPTALPGLDLSMP